MSAYSTSKIVIRDRPPWYKEAQGGEEEYEWKFKVDWEQTGKGYIDVKLEVEGLDMEEHYSHPDLMDILAQIEATFPGCRVTIRDTYGHEQIRQERPLEAYLTMAPPKARIPPTMEEEEIPLSLNL